MAKKKTAAKEKGRKFVPCQIMELPPERRIEAAQVAIRENGANAPLQHLVTAAAIAFVGNVDMDGDGVVDLVEDTVTRMADDPSFLASITSKYWGSAGVNLTVSFLDNPSAALINRILANFNAWGDFCNAQFHWTQSGGDIRIARNESALYSYMGTDIRLVPANQHTMMLGGYSDRTPDSEIRRSGSHECGHSMGFAHEHLRRALIQRLDVAKTLAYFRRTQGWSEATTRSNVLTPLEDRSIMGSDLTDDVSIMCYGLPGTITMDGRPIPGGVDFSRTDRSFAATLYPKAVTPPPPPPPEESQTQITLVFEKGKTVPPFECFVGERSGASATVNVVRQ